MAWSGSGYWVAVCNLIGGAAAFGLAYVLRQPDNITGAVFFAAWGILSGVLIFFTTRAIMSKPPRRLRDEQSGQVIEVPRGGDFSYLPMGSWAFINPIGALIAAAVIYLGYWNPVAQLHLG